jgi:hypothetical protein
MRFPPRHLAFLVCVLVLIGSACQQLTKEERHEFYMAGQKVAEPIITALEQYHADKGVYPEKLSLLVPQYLSEIPNPTSEQKFSYGLWDAGEGFLLGFLVEEDSGCGYTPRFGWDCGFGD